MPRRSAASEPGQRVAQDPAGPGGHRHLAGHHQHRCAGPLGGQWRRSGSPRRPGSARGHARAARRPAGTARGRACRAGTSSPHTVTAKCSRPMASSAISVSARSVLVTSAAASPPRRRCAAPPRAWPPLQAGGEQLAGALGHPAAACAAASGSRAGRGRRTAGRACAAMFEPTIAARAAATELAAEPARGVGEETVQSFSESTSVPSMSHRTRRGPRPGRPDSAGIEVLRLGVVGHHRVGGLLGVQLQLLGQLTPIRPGSAAPRSSCGPPGSGRRRSPASSGRRGSRA